MKSLRVLWLSHFVPYPPLSGAVQRSFQLLRTLAGHHAVTVLALNRRALLVPPQVPAAIRTLEELPLSIEVHYPFAERGSAAWAGVAALSYLGPAPFGVNWLFSRSYRAAVREHMESGRFDLVHVDTVTLGPAVGSRRSRTPVVVNHHNIESEMLARRVDREPSRWKRAYFRREAAKLAALERKVCPEAALNLVVSALDGQRLEAVAPGSAWQVVENGVDTDYFTPAPHAPSGDPRHLVFSGTMGWYPNDDAMRFFLQEIWPMLISRDPGYRITIVGRGPSRALRDLAAGDPRIRITGEVPDVRPYLREAAVYVCPMRVGGGTRLKILEALATGLPLVASSLAIEGLRVEPGLHYLGAETPHDMVDAILGLRDRPEQARALGNAGRKLVEALYAWSACGTHLEDAYRQVLDRSASSS